MYGPGDATASQPKELDSRSSGDFAGWHGQPSSAVRVPQASEAAEQLWSSQADSQASCCFATRTIAAATVRATQRKNSDSLLQH